MKQQIVCKNIFSIISYYLKIQNGSRNFSKSSAEIMVCEHPECRNKGFLKRKNPCQM